MWLNCPEFPLRYPPRITVRGHPVQGGSVTLRKALLRSRMCPWSTRRPCGPLAFRRATEGSRVRGKMWGCQEGDKKPGGCLDPLLPPRSLGGGTRGATPPRGVSYPPLAPAAGRRPSPRHVMANIPRPRRASLACGGKPPYRRKVNRQPTVKKQRLASAEKQKPPGSPGGSQYLCEQQNISFRGCA